VSKVYIAMRGATDQRIITRDAKPGHFVSLVVGHGNGDATRYELTYDGLAVALTVKYPGKVTKILTVDDGLLDFESIEPG